MSGQKSCWPYSVLDKGPDSPTNINSVVPEATGESLPSLAGAESLLILQLEELRMSSLVSSSFVKAFGFRQGERNSNAVSEVLPDHNS